MIEKQIYRRKEQSLANEAKRMYKKYFWEKAKAGVAGVSTMSGITSEVKPSGTKLELLPRPKNEKLDGSEESPFPLGREIVLQLYKDPDWVCSLKAVVRKNSMGKKVLDVRVFSDHTAAANKVKVRDYASLDEHPELILFEGRFDEASVRQKANQREVIRHIDQLSAG